ncbi:molybdenum ABC transporter permease [Sphingobacterium athyrii]|uniref:molybdenum ABC transporter permease n=1 Tax=Sphingobacterium athyrii TaxID=2152717 RepID=UPI00406BCDA3
MKKKKIRIFIATKTLNMTPLLVMGIGFLILGLALRYWINRRKFYRRGPAGAEGFSSYERSVIITLVERFGKWIAYALIILGIGFLWTARTFKKDQERRQKSIEAYQK